MRQRGLGLSALRTPTLRSESRAEGFTLIETMVVVGIIALLLPVLTTSIRQLTVQTGRNTTQVTALIPLEDTGRRLGRDIPQAQATDLGISDPPGRMTLYWTYWGDKSNYDSYSATSVAYKRVRVRYTLVGTKITRTVATCANTLDTDVQCSNPTQVVSPLCSGDPWCPDTKWVDGQPALTSSGTFNTASRVADPGSPATIASYITTAQFSLASSPTCPSGCLFTAVLSSYPKGSGFPGEARTYRAYGVLLGSVDPIQ